MKPLNAVFCHTICGHACIDWIEAGTRNLLARLLHPGQLKWNSAVDAAAIADLIVAAGAAEWRGSQFRLLLELRAAVKPAWLFVGLDHFDAGLRLTAAEAEVLRRALVITRSESAHKFLAQAGISSIVLPCPSLFVSSWESPSRNLRSVALVADCPCHSRPSSSVGLAAMHHCVNVLKGHYEVRILCRSTCRYFDLAGHWAKYVLFCPSVSECVRAMSGCDIIVAGCTHTAFVSHSLLKPAILLNVSATDSSAAEQCPHLICSTPFGLLRDVEQIDIDTLPRVLLNWKRSVEAQYLALVSSWFRDHGLHRF